MPWAELWGGGVGRYGEGSGYYGNRWPGGQWLKECVCTQRCMLGGDPCWHSEMARGWEGCVEVCVCVCVHLKKDEMRKSKSVFVCEYVFY